MSKIVISGSSGKMGHAVADVILNRTDCEILAGIDLNPVKYSDFAVYTSPNDLPEVPDVIVDFSHPSALDGLLNYAQTNGVALVLASTGYAPEQVAKIKSAAAGIPVFFTANMSLGINLLSELAKKAATVLGDQFDIEIIEKHHNKKLDAPSGTALMLADAINEASDGRYNYTYDRHSVRRSRDNQEIGILSLRGGTIVGEHDIVFAGRDEVITLSHSAASKEVFAVGAVNAAVFVCGKAPGLYTMADLL